MSRAAGASGSSSGPGRVRVLIVDDSSEYLANESASHDHLSTLIAPRFYYTNYENRLIRMFHGTPVIGNLMSHLVFWLVCIYAAIEIFLRYRTYEYKLFVNPIVGFFYCFLVGVARRREQIGLAGFLFVHKRSALYVRFRKWFANYSCHNAALIFVYSRSEMAEYSQMFPELSSKFRFVLYGRDFRIFGSRAFEPSQPYIASGGITNRDFGTLVRAMWILSEDKYPVHCKIATRAGQLGAGPIPPNLEILGNIRIDQFGDFVQKASLIVLPLKQTQVSGGHMVLLEAMSRGKLAVVADTPGVRDYVGPDLAILYKAGDPVDLARAIRFALEHFDKHEIQTLVQGGQKKYRRCYMHVHLLERLVKELLHSSGGSVKSGMI
jgi:glycosyltransferase involved in cell wall biosynthesis